MAFKDSVEMLIHLINGVMMMKDKIKEMFSADNIRRTLISAVFIGSLIYLMVTSFSFGALITVGLAGYVGLYPR